jgi:hypothetical protein
MPRFDLYRNPNQRAAHGLYLDVQSDLVSTSTRWCLPMFKQIEGAPLLTRAHWAVDVDDQSWVVDTPNVLAVPKTLLRERRGRLASEDPLRVEAAIDFMLRGY